MQLSGFNNLKKTLSFSFYDFVIALSESEKLSYIEYINENYNAKKINALLRRIVSIIDANILYESLQDYQPYGASSMLLMEDANTVNMNMHLDKSHITAHTYPDFENTDTVLSFRVDIELSTCGEITLLNSLNEIFGFFDTDLVTIDYNVRGFTRDKKGNHIYMDHNLNSIQEYIDDTILKNYKAKDLILENENIWQLKLLRVNSDIDTYFSPETNLMRAEKLRYMDELNKEMLSIFNGWRA